MNKIKKSIAVCLASLTIVASAGCKTTNTSDNISSGDNPTSSESENMNLEEEIGYLKNSLSELNLKGYVGNNYKNNVNYWQKVAYKNNPNIITQIYRANKTSGNSSLSDVFGTDFFGVDSYYDIDVVSKNLKKYIGWKLKYLPSSFGDRDLRFANDTNSESDWTGAKELWIHIDNSEIGGLTSLRVCFEDDAFGRESFSLITGKSINLYNSSTPIVSVVSAGGYVDIPEYFVGYIAIPLNSSYYERYYSDGGNNQIDLNNVAQFQIAVKATGASINKTFYMNDFAIVGNVNGGSLPFNIAGEDTFKIVWNIETLDPKDDTPDAQPSGLPWYGEFVGKLLTGIAFSYKSTRDAELMQAANEIIDALEEAQGNDGYLGTYRGGARYSIASNNWDLWNQYHAIVGLAEWYKITENTKALTIAKKALDCIYETFKNRSYLVSGGFETNRGIAHGYALMYQVTGEKKYLDEAERIIMQDCQDSNGWYKGALKGVNFFQTSSARWEVLHMIMTLGILYQETGKQEYFQVMSFVWNSILSTDIHNSGGFTTNEAAIGNPYAEGVIETCCTIAWNAFSIEYYKVCKKVEVADEIERSYFNGLLGALTDDDKYCTYNTPMNGIQGSAGTYDGRRVKSQQDISFQFNSGSPDMNCCQANFARGIGQLSEWAALTDGPSLYLNYYGNSNIKAMANGVSFNINQVTSYPINGQVKITIDGLQKASRFVLKLRIPSWSVNSKVSYDGQTFNCESNKYFAIDKIWHNGDEIILDIGMQFTVWVGLSYQSGYTSLYWGPILFTLDEHYLNQSNCGVSFTHNIALSPEAFENVEVKNGNTISAWAYIDIPYNNTFVRLVDFASAGKYNGKSQPSSYYSWLNIDGVSYVDIDFLDIWKLPLL